MRKPVWLMLVLLFSFESLPAWDSHPLYDAVAENNIREVTRLLQNEDNLRVLNNPPANYAESAKESNDPLGGRITPYCQNLAMLKLLVGKGLKILPEDGYSLALFIENSGISHEQTFQMVKYIFEKGADINFVHPYHKLTPLHYSMKYKTFKITDYLVKNGADVNARDKEGATPLHGLLSNFDHETRFVKPKAQLLVKKGADINARDNKGQTPLMYAVREIVEEPVYVLVNLGANVNAKDNRGDTVLHFAAFSSNSKKVAFLLKHGADKSVRNQDGKTAADLLREQMSSYTDEGRKDILYKEMEKMLPMLQ